jgi:hypothetical protein
MFCVFRDAAVLWFRLHHAILLFRYGSKNDFGDRRELSTMTVKILKHSTTR